MPVNINVMITRIENIAKAEKVTKADLAELSRELIAYIVLEDSNDISMVNRLLGVLSPANKRVATHYFQHFLFFKLNEDIMLFEGKMKGAKRLARYVELVTEFLDNQDNNIWTWQAEHLKIDKKIPDYKKKIKGDVQKALADEENGLTQQEIMQAVFEGGVTVDVILAILDNMTQEAA